MKKIIIFFLMTATGPLLPAHRCVVELPLSPLHRGVGEPLPLRTGATAA